MLNQHQIQNVGARSSVYGLFRLKLSESQWINAKEEHTDSSANRSIQKLPINILKRFNTLVYKPDNEPCYSSCYRLYSITKCIVSMHIGLWVEVSSIQCTTAVWYGIGCRFIHFVHPFIHMNIVYILFMFMLTRIITFMLCSRSCTRYTVRSQHGPIKRMFNASATTEGQNSKNLSTIF